jgi:hypothetical protein
MTEYDITKLINTVGKQTQVIDVLVRKIDTLDKTVTEMAATIEAMANDLLDKSHV